MSVDLRSEPSAASLAPLDTLDGYRRLFTDAALCAPLGRTIRRRHELAADGDVRSGLPGTYPTFIVGECWVVKLFGRLFEGAVGWPWPYIVFPFVPGVSSVLLHRFDPLARAFTIYPQAREAPSLDELARLLWDVDAPACPVPARRV
jgi:hypothetical protein